MQGLVDMGHEDAAQNLKVISSNPVPATTFTELSNEGGTSVPDIAMSWTINVQLDERSILLQQPAMRAPHSSEREQRPWIVAFQREPIPRCRLHVAIGLAECGCWYGASALLNGTRARSPSEPCRRERS